MLFDAIPQELKTQGLWCCWKLTSKGKLPFDIKTGSMAKSNDKTTFSTFTETLKVLNKYLGYDKEGKQTGGLGIGVFNGFCAIDIDKCRDSKTGEITEMAKDIIDFCDSYTEISPSGTGIRIIFKTDTQLDKSTHYIKNSKIGLEIYISEQTKRFVTITGDFIKRNEIKKIDLTYVLDKYMLKENKVISAFDKILSKDKKMNDLWNKKAPGSGLDESETDLALCSKLAYYFEGNQTAINEHFISSPYFQSKDVEHKKKWLEREDYKEMTLSKAITTYNSSSKRMTDLIFELSDTGNAHRFIDNFGEDLKYNIEDKMWHIWNKKFWQRDSINYTKILAEILAEEMKQKALLCSNKNDRNDMLKNVSRMLSSAGKEAFLKEARHLEGVPITNNIFDKDIFLLNTETGVINLRTGEITPHDKTYMMSKIIPYEIDKRPPKRWLQFLDEIFADQLPTIDYIHKMIGYSLTGSTQEQCIFFFVGDGNNGKSLLLEVMATMMGDYSATTKPDVFLEKPTAQSNAASPELAKLVGIRMSAISETNVGAKLNESAVKSYTSGLEKIVARRLYGDEFEFRPMVKFVMASNNKPIIRGTDKGIWRRIRVITFNQDFEGEKDDKRLIDKLLDEIPRILWWAIQGAVKWYKEGLKTPRVIEDNIKEYKSEMDLIQRWIDEDCEIGFDYEEKSMSLFENFCNYIYTNKEYQMSNTAFGRNLGKKFPKKIKNGVTYYQGIKLKPGKKFKGKYDDI